MARPGVPQRAYNRTPLRMRAPPGGSSTGRPREMEAITQGA